MAIINNAMQAAPQAVPQDQQGAPSAQAPGQAPQQGMDKIVSRIVTAATMAMNQPQTEQQILQMVKSSADPVQGLAQATVALMKALFAKSNKTMPPQAIGPAGKQVMLVIAQACQSAGILKVTPQLVQQAMAAAVKMIGSAQPQAPATPAPAAPAAPMGA